MELTPLHSSYSSLAFELTLGQFYDYHPDINLIRRSMKGIFSSGFLSVYAIPLSFLSTFSSVPSSLAPNTSFSPSTLSSDSIIYIIKKFKTISSSHLDIINNKIMANIEKTHSYNKLNIIFPFNYEEANKFYRNYFITVLQSGGSSYNLSRVLASFYLEPYITSYSPSTVYSPSLFSPPSTPPSNSHNPSHFPTPQAKPSSFFSTNQSSINTCLFELPPSQSNSNSFQDNSSNIFSSTTSSSTFTTTSSATNSITHTPPSSSPYPSSYQTDGNKHKISSDENPTSLKKQKMNENSLVSSPQPYHPSSFSNTNLLSTFSSSLSFTSLPSNSSSCSPIPTTISASTTSPNNSSDINSNNNTNNVFSHQFEESFIHFPSSVSTSSSYQFSNDKSKKTKQGLNCNGYSSFTPSMIFSPSLYYKNNNNHSIMIIYNSR